MVMADETKKMIAESEADAVTADGTPTTAVKMTVTLPRSVAAFLRWKAETEGMRRDELLRRIITHYARKLRERDMKTPPIVDE